MFSKDNVNVNIIIIIIIIVITSPDWLAPDAALVSQSQGPEELVSLQPACVESPVVVIVVVTSEAGSIFYPNFA